MRLIQATLLATTFGLVAISAQAQNTNIDPKSTVSIGYSHGKISGADSIDGVNLKYNHELNQQPWGVMTSLTYMSGKQDGDISSGAHRYSNDVDFDYYSAGVGPSYRVNPNVNVYGLVGVSKSDAKGTQRRTDNNATYYVNDKSTAFMYGAGVQYNPAPNWSVDLGYEGTRVSDGYDKRSMNALNLGVGYRF